MGLILPLLVALVVDAYVLLPIRLSLKKSDTPTIHIWEEWALGVVLARIGMRVMEMQPPNEYSRALELVSPL
jgi:E3 ubiquitin-protein ligase MARCH6